jgi:hypothetical protein
VRRGPLLTAASLAAVGVFLLATLPPAPVSLDVSYADPSLVGRTVAGAYHIHTTRSDGAEDKASIAAAAARAGLTFAIFTDHGDGTQPPDPPAYLSGVLCIDGVEISTNGGHYVALDMSAAPYPLGGEAAAVVEDVARLGGFGVAAHPHSAKPELAWTDWRAPIDGLEWLNVDSEWRDESRPRLTRALIGYLVRPAPAIAAVLDRPDATLDQWQRLSQQRRVVALAALDVHGGVRTRLEGSSRFGVGPSYEASFRTLSSRVILERPLIGDAAADARALLDGIRQGRVYTAIDAIASGAYVDPRTGDPAWPQDARVAQMGPDGKAGWFEVYRAGAPGEPPIPWILTNPVEAPEPSPAHAAVDLGAGVAVNEGWRIEKHASSVGSVVVTGDGNVVVNFRLHSGPRESQFVALAGDLAGGVAAEHIVFDGLATGPMRVSVQFRFPGSEQRWIKSVYLDAQPRTIVVPVGEMVPAERQAGAVRPDPSAARSLLFVVDLTNASPGSQGSFTISSVRLMPRRVADSRDGLRSALRRNLLHRRDQVARQQSVPERLAERPFGDLPGSRRLPRL